MLVPMSTPPPALAATPPGEWLAQMAQAIDHIFWVCDARSGRLLYANPAFEHFWGPGTDEEALLALVAQADRDRLVQARRAVLEAPYSEEYGVDLPARADRPARKARLREKAFRTRAASGEDWITHVAHDISWLVDTAAQHRAAERALAESEDKYRKVVENVNEGILITAGGRILYANPKALDLTGLDEQTAKSRPFIDFIHPDDRERVLGNHLRRLRGEEVENHYQFRVIHRDGHARWLEISAVKFDWQNAPATLNFLTDVTERRRIEQDMRAALARERELSELKSRFVAMTSHEFRTPLAGILSSIEVLDGYGARLPDAERHEIVGQVKEAVARMNRMVDQVLVTSRLESGQFAFEPRPRCIPELLVQVASEMDQAHPQASRIALRCDGVDQPRLVDAKLVGHILVNLLGNALKYSPPDSAVTCTASAAGDRLRFCVADKGIGIPASDLPRLFESFHRGTNVGNVQGTGIGLSIVKECVQLHQGSIQVESVPGEGATFRVDLHAPVAT